MFDRDTGKPKGYGFCEFAGTSSVRSHHHIHSSPPDHETALSAVRNLNGHELGGRPLRIDLADSDPFLEGKTTVRGEIIDGGETRAQWRERHDRERHGDRHEKDYRGNEMNTFLASIQKGVPLPGGTNSLDVITQVLGTTETSKTYEVLAQMKVRAFYSRRKNKFHGISAGIRHNASRVCACTACGSSSAGLRALPSIAGPQYRRPCNPQCTRLAFLLIILTSLTFSSVCLIPLAPRSPNQRLPRLQPQRIHLTLLLRHTYPLLPVSLSRQCILHRSLLRRIRPCTTLRLRFLRPTCTGNRPRKCLRPTIAVLLQARCLRILSNCPHQVCLLLVR